MMRFVAGIPQLVAICVAFVVGVGCRTDRLRPVSVEQTPVALSAHLRSLTNEYAQIDTSVVANADSLFYQELDSVAKSLIQRISAQCGPKQIINAMNECVFGHWGITFSDDRNNVRYLLPHLVVKEKKGSCVGMSLLYLLLAERAGLPLFAVRAPSHLFVRYDDGRERLNIETLRRGEIMSDAWYRERFLITDSMRFPLRNLTGMEGAAVVAYNLGTICYNDKRYGNAIEFLQKAIAAMPGFVEAQGNLALAFEAKGEVRRALELLLDLRSAFPSLELIDRNIASLQLRSGNYREALASFDAAYSRQTDDPDAHYGRAVALYRLHRSKEAVAALERALELRKDFPPAEELRRELR